MRQPLALLAVPVSLAVGCALLSAAAQGADPGLPPCAAHRADREGLAEVVAARRRDRGPGFPPRR